MAAGITPALRFNFLTPGYDWVVRFTTRESLFKKILVDEVLMCEGDALLDVGCGTGTLLKAFAERAPNTRLTGIDADPAILAIARRKLNDVHSKVDLVPGNSNRMPFEPATYDHVVSTLFFHHLSPANKKTTASEILRVLRPGGTLNVVDWGKPTGRLQRSAFFAVQLLDGIENTRGHVLGQLPALFRDTGFCDVTETSFLRTAFGTLRFIRAGKPANRKT